MKANEFVKGKDFSSSKGLPIGRTTIDLETADFKTKDFLQDNGETRTANQVTLVIDGKEETYNLPASVMKKVQEATLRPEVKGIEINRDGKTKTDTHYVSYFLDTNGKIIKE